MIKTIFFDLGGVTLTDDSYYYKSDKFRAKFVKKFKINPDKILEAWKTSWPLIKTGKISEEVFWQEFLTNTNAKNTNVEEAKKFWRKYNCEPIKGTSKILKKLNKNYEVICIASTGKEWLDYKKEKYNLNRYFKEIISSAETGIKKTEEGIYKIALSKTKSKPEECLFIDNKPNNQKIAEKLGIKILLFKDAKQLKQDLKEFDISI